MVIIQNMYPHNSHNQRKELLHKPIKLFPIVGMSMIVLPSNIFVSLSTQRIVGIHSWAHLRFIHVSAAVLDFCFVNWGLRRYIERSSAQAFFVNGLRAHCRWHALVDVRLTPVILLVWIYDRKIKRFVCQTRNPF